MYDFKNFNLATFALFSSCERPERDPDYYSYSGSTYWDVGSGVIRWSTHWGHDIRSCHWYIDERLFYSRDKCVAGFCLYKDFKPASYHHSWKWKYGVTPLKDKYERRTRALQRTS